MAVAHMWDFPVMEGISFENANHVHPLLEEWEAQSRYDMDFLVEKRKLDAAVREVKAFLDVNGIHKELRNELQDSAVKKRLLKCLPENKRDCSDFELNCYYIMFKKKIEG